MRRATIKGEKRLPEMHDVKGFPVLEWARNARRRPPRPRGWDKAGMRSNRLLNEQKLAALDHLQKGRAVAVTRRWPS